MTPPRIFRLFVSSTFSDFIAEREALQKHVFPKLEDYCARRGASFQAIDLRWGITEDAQRDRETIQICLEEVRRCQKLSPRPNFAILLSHRYGWEPIPERISEDHWARLITELKRQPDDTSLETLKCAYRLDTNAVPPTYCLKPDQTRTNEIQRILRCAAESFTGFDRLPYFGSATHQEIALGALGISDAEEHVHAYVRLIKNLPDDATAQAFIDWNHKAEQKVSGASDRLKELESKLRDRLGEDKVHDFECFWNRGLQTVTHHHLKRFCDEFLQHQMGLIDQELARLQQNETEQTANEAHDSFAREYSENFVGRKTILDQIEHYLQSSENKKAPLIATGEGGAGKTSIIAQSYLNTFENQPTIISPVVLCRFIGGVAGIESLKGLLESLISEITATYGIEGKQTDPKMKSPREAFEAALENATEEKPLWIFIDALDQLEATDNLPLAEWMPEILPTHVRLILSSRPRVPPTSIHQSFNHIKINRMTLQEGDTLLSKWLVSPEQQHLSTDAYSSHRRTVTPEQRRSLLEPDKEYVNPLWLKLAYEKARRWHSWDCPQQLPATVAELVETFIENYLIEQRKHPPIFTRKALSYIAAGRYGLSEEEITKALGTDPFVRAEFEEQEKTTTKWASKESLPPILLSRLLLDLQPYLTSAFSDGALVYRYFHREFEEAIKKKYFKGRQKALLHTHLAEVFFTPDASDLYLQTDITRKTQDRQTDISKKKQDSRALRRIMEQPWQLAQAGQGEKLRSLLMDFGFCMAKSAANRSEDLIQDYIRARDVEPVDDWDWGIWSGHIINRIAPTLSRASHSWPAHRILLQLALEHADDSPLTIASQKWFEQHETEWECQYLASRAQQAKPDNCLHAFNLYEEIAEVKLLPNNRFVSLSYGGSFKIWNSETLMTIKEWKASHDSNRNLLILKDDRFVSWGGSNSRLWSTDGDLLATFHHPSVEPTENGSTNSFPVHVLELSDGRILTQSKTNTYRLYSATGGEPIVFRNPNDIPSYWDPISRVVYKTTIIELLDGRLLSFGKNNLNFWSQFGEHLKEITEGSDSITGVKELSSGNLVSWSGNKVQLRSSDGECLKVLDGTGCRVRDVIELSDGRLISMTDSESDSPVLWSSTGQHLKYLYVFSPVTVFLELSDGRLLFGLEDSNLSIFYPNGRLEKHLRGHSGPIKSAYELSDGCVLSLSDDRTMRLWSPRGKPLAVMEGNAGHPGCVELSNSRLLSWSGEALRIWSLTDSTPDSPEAHKGAVLGAIKGKNELLDPIYTWSSDGTIGLWFEYCEIHTFKADLLGNQILGVHERASGELLSWSTDTAIAVFNYPEEQRTAYLHGHTDRVNGVVELSDGYILSWSDDKTLRLWSPTGESIAVLEGHKHAVIGARELSNGILESYSLPNDVHANEIIWWTPKGVLLNICSVYKNICELSYDRRLVYDCYEGYLEATGEALEGTGKALKIIGSEGICELKLERDPYSGYPKSAIELSDGRLLGWRRYMMWLWSAKGELLAEFEGDFGFPDIEEVLETTDGHLLSWADDRTIQLWSTTFENLAVYQGHSAPIRQVVELSEERLLSWSQDEIIIWDKYSGRKEAVVFPSTRFDYVFNDRQGGPTLVFTESASNRGAILKALIEGKQIVEDEGLDEVISDGQEPRSCCDVDWGSLSF